MIVHVVNDCTSNWGGAFARALRDRYPEAQERFRAWAATRGLRLGATGVAEVQPGLWVASMVAQAGYGPSRLPRIRYLALRECLRVVAQAAREHGAHVHMPRIGAGEAGGRWAVIEELIDEALVQHDIPTTVYSLPGERWPAEERQIALPLD
jgi:O-acetyl-ADP-ribose deacetylase (regulator of RNase III)